MILSWGTDGDLGGQDRGVEGVGHGGAGLHHGALSVILHPALVERQAHLGEVVNPDQRQQQN